MKKSLMQFFSATGSVFMRKIMLQSSRPEERAGKILCLARSVFGIDKSTHTLIIAYQASNNASAISSVLESICSAPSLISSFL